MTVACDGQVEMRGDSSLRSDTLRLVVWLEIRRYTSLSGLNTLQPQRPHIQNLPTCQPNSTQPMHTEK